MAGLVSVNGKVVLKSDQNVTEADTITVSEGARYVSRGGDKLEGALSDLSVSPKGRVCVDVGSSTGGFTDCLLKNGATKIYAIDVGHHQLDDSLRSDSRVVAMEDKHILDVEPGSLIPKPNLAVIDVSFISLTRVLGRVKDLLEQSSEVVALVKPQFEVGPKHLKKGVVRSVEKQQEAVATVRAKAEELGFIVQGEAPSKLKGPKGNQEYFLHLVMS